MTIKEITFYFENCECITIEGKYIGDFYVGDIKKEIRRIACNAIEEVNTAETIYIEISKSANFEISKEKIFKRISEGDITQIEFVLYDQYGTDTRKKKYQYYVSWDGEDDFTNESMNCFTSMVGNLYILISRDKKFEDFIDYESINSKEDIDTKFLIYDVK